ncbi:beta-1,6-galactofuranosyltransferase [Rodentibacter ratti]|uniref:Beta-1,6-galactofuranosyltransferase n=1 Tax=Rodentibacter ratti TaxID=1906745 RepID=A0A1V3KRK5_9PAST|nr:sugar transferase [Rodentibacter ratti]OOF80309.1 beta-1,6-galactofuranosyltransferase [Rodentibacter ratti]
MKKYQLVELSTEYNHAGSKAVQDVFNVANNLGYEVKVIRTATSVDSLWGKIKRQALFFIDWLKIYFSITPNSLVLIQNPYHHKQLIRNWVFNKLKKDKKVKFISLVHDVEELRKSLYNDYYKKEFNFMLSIADSIIVHNDTMKAFFIEKGVPESKLVSLKIFDYLMDKEALTSTPSFEQAISIAGNLDIKKSAYIAQLGNLGITVHLYGPNFSHLLEKYKDIQYHGSFPASDIPTQLNSGFGLVWDGNSIDTCSGDFGEYLRYNNPHKLSLYLASGIPVVIWDKAAEADFVREHNVGICVSSLNELKDKLEQISEEDYQEMVRNVVNISSLLCHGEHTKNSIRISESLV